MAQALHVAVAPATIKEHTMTSNEHNTSHTSPTDAVDAALGEHPVSTSVGAAGGAVTGAAIGTVAGPVGSVVGAVIGAVVGGLAGKGVAEYIVSPTVEDEYWRDAYVREPYYSDGYTYDDYAPAYRAGYTSRIEGKANWNDARTEWERRWDEEHANGRLRWKDAEPAVQSAWERANRAYVTQNQG
jgi:hypothetical protein